jgi:isoquinoline 1-oxidoreductase alpha subunit
MVNGVEHAFDGDPEMPLLWYPRDQLQFTGTKYGCGIGLCGVCTVHVNGVATRSCITVMGSIAGKDIVIIDGLSPQREHPVQQAWKSANVPQCGYCQSGQIMQAVALLQDKPKLTHGRGHRRRHAGQYLALWDLSTHPRGRNQRHWRHTL